MLAAAEKLQRRSPDRWELFRTSYSVAPGAAGAFAALPAEPNPRGASLGLRPSLHFSRSFKPFGLNGLGKVAENYAETTYLRESSTEVEDSGNIEFLGGFAL
jgi:hypothetical protein